MRVPKDIQEALGIKEIKRTLHTRDEGEALKRRFAVVAEILTLFDEARNPKVTDSHSKLRDLVKALRQGDEPEQELLPVELFGIAADNFIQENYGNPNDPEVRDSIKPEDIAAIRSMSHLVKNPDAQPLSEAITTYLAEKKQMVTNQTFNTKARRLEDFAQWIGTDTIIDTITKKKAGQYVTSRLVSMKDRYDRQLSAKTKKDTASDIRAFFMWCEGRGYIETNPLTNIMKTLGTVIKGAPSDRRAWNRSELVKLLSDPVLRKSKVMMGLVLVGLYTGMRGNEIAELRREDVTDEYLRVTQGKNKNSIRKVPIHTKIAPLVEHLKSTSKDEYLLEGLTRGGEDKKRYHNIGKKFNRRRVKLGFSKDIVFHSFRNTLATSLENSGVTRDLAEMVAGHSDQNRGVTYSLYSDGLAHDVLAETLNKASYGEEVDALVEEVIAEITT